MYKYEMYICNMLLYVLLSCCVGMINASGNHTSVVRVRRVQYPFWIFILVFSIVSSLVVLFVCCKVAPAEIKKRRARFVQVV